MAHRVAPRAAADLDDIWYYVAKESGSIEVATRLIDSITDRYFLVASHPYLAAPAMTTLALARGVSCWRVRHRLLHRGGGRAVSGIDRPTPDLRSAAYAVD